jgi:hypothetical protein
MAGLDRNSRAMLPLVGTRIAAAALEDEVS